MPRRKNAVPTYSLHKPTGQARTRIAGRDIYLGPYGSRESRLRFAMLAAELARDDRPARGERAEHRRDDAGDERRDEASATTDAATADDPDRRADRAAARARRRSDRTLARVGCEPVGYSVAELAERFVAWCGERYGTSPTGFDHASTYLARSVALDLAERFGRLDVALFGPRSLRELRDRWADSGRFCRREVNRRQRTVVRMFRWGVAEELVPSPTLHALAALEGLRFGQTSARENPPRRPCSDAQIAAALTRLPPPAAALLRMLRATGMRPDEACRMRLRDIDASGDIWLYRLDSHKTAYRGHERVVPLNADAQAIVRSLMARPDGSPRPLDAFLFDPAEGVRGNRFGRFVPNGLLQAVRRACDAAGVERFVPYAVRHLVATELRNRLGIEAVEAVLGQRSPAVAERYSRDKTARAVEAVRMIGGAA